MPYEDLMTYLQQQQAQRKAAGTPTWQIPELQEIGRGVTREKELATRESMKLQEEKRQFGERMEFTEGQQRRGDIASMTTLPTSMVSTYALGKQAELWGSTPAAGGATTAPVATGVGTAGPSMTGTGAGFSADVAMESGGVAASQGGFFAGAGSAAGPAAIAGGVAGAYGPYRKEAGSLALMGKGGEKEQVTAGGAVAGAGAGALAGAAMTSWSGPGAIVGTIVGALVGGISAYFSSKKGGKGGGGTVICTELLRQGLVSQELVDLEHKYDFPWDVYWGYRIWADPVVEGMKKSKLLTLFMAVLGKAFLEEVAHRVEPERKGNLLGSLIIKVGSPICKRLFWYRTKKYAYMYMWQQEMIQKVGE